MYFIFGIFFLLCLLCFFLCRRRACRIIRKVCDMKLCDKLALLNGLAEPLGYSYLPDKDIMTSQTDAWQRAFGYSGLYDRSAVYFNMVFDCLPVYFDYQGRTWLIEFWKGQYGVNTGGEIGIYQSDALLAPGELDTARFDAVPDSRLLPISMELYRQGKLLFSIKRIHWWLTGFRTGTYSEPADLAMKASVAFPDCEMLKGFLQGLDRAGFKDCDVQVCHLTVTLFFHSSETPKRCGLTALAARISQWKNRVFCRLYCRITRPFSCTLDKILYLYFFLPFVFRRILRPRKYPGRQSQRSRL